VTNKSQMKNKRIL